MVVFYINIVACTRPPSGLVLGCQTFHLLLPDTSKVTLSHEHGCTNSQVLLTCVKCVNTMHCQITMYCHLQEDMGRQGSNCASIGLPDIPSAAT